MEILKCVSVWGGGMTLGWGWTWFQAIREGVGARGGGRGYLSNELFLNSKFCIYPGINDPPPLHHPRAPPPLHNPLAPAPSSTPPPPTHNTRNHNNSMISELDNTGENTY